LRIILIILLSKFVLRRLRLRFVVFCANC